MEKTDITVNTVDQLSMPSTPEGSVLSASRYSVLLAWIEIGLILVGLVFVAILLPRDTGGDGWQRYQDLSRVLSGKSLYQPDARYSLIGPFFSLPLYYIGKDFFKTPYPTITLYNLLLFSTCLLIVYFLLRNRMDRGLLRKFFLVLIYGSMFVAHLALYYGEVFTTLFVGFGLLITFLGTRFAIGWVVVALGVANTPVTLFALGIMILKRVIDRKRFRYFLVIVLAILFIGVESLVRRGTFLGNNYSNDHGYKTIMPYSGLPDFSYPFFFGLLSILFSFGKGLLFFTPGLLLPVRKTLLRWMPGKQINLYQVYVLWIYFLIGLILIYAPWWAWYGGSFWGPRFFLFASLPASLALAIRLLRYKEASFGVNLLTLAVFGLSVWVSIDGAVFQWVAVNAATCVKNHYALEALCLYTPEYSVLWQPFVFPMPIHFGQKIFLVYSLLVAIYIGTPLFIHTLRQFCQNVQKLIHTSLNVWTWRV